MQRVDGEAAMLNYTPNLFRKTTGEPQDLLNFHATIHRVTV